MKRIDPDWRETGLNYRVTDLQCAIDATISVGCTNNRESDDENCVLNKVAGRRDNDGNITAVVNN